jgi:hypothetical protein
VLGTDEARAIDRESKSLYDNHVGQLLSAGNRIAEYDPQRPASVKDVYEVFLSDTFTALAEYDSRFVERMVYMVQTIRTDVDAAEKDEVLSCAKKYVDEDLYKKRRQIFEEGFARQLSRYGQRLEPEAHRFDLFRARYDAGSVNATRRIIQRLTHELDLLVLSTRKTEDKTTVASEPDRLWDALGLRPGMFGISVDLKSIGRWWRKRKSRT